MENMSAEAMLVEIKQAAFTGNIERIKEVEREIFQRESKFIESMNEGNRLILLLLEESNRYNYKLHTSNSILFRSIEVSRKCDSIKIFKNFLRKSISFYDEMSESHNMFLEIIFESFGSSRDGYFYAEGQQIKWTPSRHRPRSIREIDGKFRRF